jgi:hypothetical protein
VKENGLLGLFCSADFGVLIGPQNMRWLNEPLKASLPIFYSFSFYFLFSEIYFILRKPRLTPYRLKSKKGVHRLIALKNMVCAISTYLRK